MFRRRSAKDDVVATDAAPTAEEMQRLQGQEAKGRPTPRRKEAEVARKQRLTPPKDRKEAAKRMRQKRYEARQKTHSALKSGSEANLPKRDRGKVRRFCRDLVDARRNVAEYLLPLLIVILVLGFVRTPASGYAQLFLWLTTIVGTVLDTIYLVFKTRRELAKRFPGENRRGAVGYTVLRSSQLRRFRLPKPQVERGAALPERY
ncbi:MAG: DUF3043 domain-containing protein [Nocardioidaceae bacterium]|nr:DUF3043 domain-containing protein [Nocardioidaceae bacterium]MDQ3165894.1 DUF3043 domain-containing protein [Actinomycetota bacterium]